LSFLFLYLLNGFQPPKAGKVNSIGRVLQLRSCRLARHKKRPLLTTHKGRVLPHTIVLIQTADSATVKVNLIKVSIAGRAGFVKADFALLSGYKPFDHTQGKPVHRFTWVALC